MSGVRFFPNAAGIRQLARSAEVYREMEKKAEQAASAAREVAPQPGRNPYSTGAYQASIHVEEGTADGERAAVLTADVPYAVYVELGTSDTPTFAPLRRGAEAAGLRLRG